MNKKDLTRKLQESELNYPILAWSELEAMSEIILISSPGQIQSISKSRTGNISNLQQTLAKLLDVKDLKESALNGDENIYNFMLVDEGLSEFNWSSLISEFEKEGSSRKLNTTISKEVQKEMISNDNMDLAASSLKCIYSSIFHSLLSKSAELGITQIMFLGNLIYDEILQSVIDRHLPEHFTAYTMDL